jgi:UDP-N-acetylmuramate--alanine ligase
LPSATIGVVADSVIESATGIAASVIDRRTGEQHALALALPGRHNLANALAAIAGAAAGVPVAGRLRAGHLRRACPPLRHRRHQPSGITVIDDFGHNPEKVAATLATLAHPGRVIAFFQPHGYGPLRQMGAELAEVLATRLGPDDVTILCDPVYFGGTVDRSQGSQRIVHLIGAHGGHAEYVPAREACADRIVEIAPRATAWSSWAPATTR